MGCMVIKFKWWFTDSYLCLMLCWCLMNVACRVCCMNVFFDKLMGLCYGTLFFNHDVMVCIWFNMKFSYVEC